MVYQKRTKSQILAELKKTVITESMLGKVGYHSIGLLSSSLQKSVFPYPVTLFRITNREICIVEVTDETGKSRVTASCSLEAREGMVVRAHTEKILETRKMIAETLLVLSRIVSHDDRPMQRTHETGRRISM
jgi:hypothetical protein